MFLKDQTILFVFHSALLIDKYGNNLPGIFERLPYVKLFPENCGGKLRRDDFLEQSVSFRLCRGMVSCLRKDLLNVSIPFPSIEGSHDQWLAFCALLNDGCYYLNKQFIQYRLYGNNTCGSNAYHGNLVDSARRIRKEVIITRNQHQDLTSLVQRMTEMLVQFHLSDSDAYKTAASIVDLGQKIDNAFQSGRIVGSAKLNRLFNPDSRYRSCGTKQFIFQLLGFWTRQ